MPSARAVVCASARRSRAACGVAEIEEHLGEVDAGVGGPRSRSRLLVELDRRLEMSDRLRVSPDHRREDPEGAVDGTGRALVDVGGDPPRVWELSVVEHGGSRDVTEAPADVREHRRSQKPLLVAGNDLEVVRGELLEEPTGLGGALELDCQPGERAAVHRSCGDVARGPRQEVVAFHPLSPALAGACRAGTRNRTSAIVCCEDRPSASAYGISSSASA